MASTVDQDVDYSREEVDVRRGSVGELTGCFDEDGSLRPLLAAMHGALQCRRSYSTEERILLMQLQKDPAFDAEARLAQSSAHPLSPGAAQPPAPPPLHRRRCTAAVAPPPLHRRRCTAAVAPPPLHRRRCTAAVAPPPVAGAAGKANACSSPTAAGAGAGDHERGKKQRSRKVAGASSQSEVLYSQLIKSKDAADLLLKTCLEMTSSQTDKVDDLIGVLMKGAANLLEADRCAFFLVEGDELVSKMAEGAGEIRIPIGAGLAGHVAQSGEIINIEDAYSDSRFNQEVDKKTGYRTRSLLCAPVLYQESVIAVAQLLNKRNGVFESTDLSLFKAFASFAGVCLANAYHYHEALYEKRKNEVILEVVSRVNQTDIRDWGSVSEVVRQGCIELLAAEQRRCTLFSLDKEGGALVAVTPSGEIRISRSAGIAGH
eukprot:gene49207-32685_t